MAVINNYIYVSCDRCGTCMCYPSKEYAENLYWGFNILIGEDHVDLCPDCNQAWDNVVRKFLYNKE